MDSIYMIVPAYNEAENIGRVIEEWYPVLERCSSDPDSRLIIIDDGSTDDTSKIARGYIQNYDRLEVISRKNSGHGASIYYGYGYAIEHGADYVFQTDSDGQTSASEFEGFWNERNDNDVIIGNRYNRGDGAARRFVSRSLRLVIRVIFGVRACDINTPFRLMSRQALTDALAYLPEGYNLTNVALTAVFASMAEGKLGEDKRIRLKYLPITFKPRQGGTNSINIIKIIKLGIKAIRELGDIRKKMSV